MRRRTCLTSLVAAALPAAAAPNPIQLHVDLDVDPAKEKDLVAAFRKVFRPAISKQPGFVNVRLLKLRQAVVGEAPKDASYRLLISFQTEEQRQTWVKTDDHQQAWPAIEKTLRGKVTALLYDVV
ncbi:MAG: antibiotic biosynthesis monooxygenase [Acidobacteriota bacterium]